MAYKTEKVPGRTILIRGKEYLYFGGTSYLGIQAEPRFQKLLLNNISTYGFHHGASRISNLQLTIYDSAEAHLASWAGSPAALTVSSGFLAGQLLRAHFSNEAYKIFVAPNAHAALGGTGTVQYNSFALLAEALHRHLSGNTPGIPVVFMDSIDLSGSSYPDYNCLSALPLNQLILVADDSHGMGILGENGAGAYQLLIKLPLKELLVCGSLGKALGLQAGLVLGSMERIAGLKDSPFFAGASPPSPANMATLTEAADVYTEKRTTLLERLADFERECLCLNKFSHVKDYPVYGFNDTTLTSYLLGSGVFVTDFQYPSSQPGTLPGRIVLSAHHSIQDIKHLANLLNAYYGI